MARIRCRVTYANVVATVALFVALGGGAYAATKLPKNSVTARQIKNDSITSPKVKNRSLLAKDFKTGQLPAGAPGLKGDTGAPGLKGDTGAPGSAFAFAHVNEDGSLDTSRSSGITSVSKTRTGIYCLVMPGTPKNAVVSADSNQGGIATSASANLDPGPHITTGDCAADTNVIVFMWGSSNTAVNAGFYIAFNK